MTFEDLYLRGALSGEEVAALLDTSLGPRGPDWLYDLGAELGVGRESLVVDVGCRDGKHLLELHRRLGCRGVGVEPVAAKLARAPQGMALLRGWAQALPLATSSADLVWIRDVLVHVAPLERALREARRVLRPGGHCLIFQMFATPLLEPREADWLWSSLAVVAPNTDRRYFEAAIAAAGLRVEQHHDLASEWREQGEEHGEGRTSRQLLWAARLLRDQERLMGVLGRRGFEVELGDCLYGVYQMIGKLAPSVYVLR